MEDRCWSRRSSRAPRIEAARPAAGSTLGRLACGRCGDAQRPRATHRRDRRHACGDALRAGASRTVSAPTSGAAGCCVVSGLALGIDAAAHEGALEAGAPTIGVLGGGHRRFFPPRNLALAERMLAGGGAVLSPYPPDQPPHPPQFLRPQRHRRRPRRRGRRDRSPGAQRRAQYRRLGGRAAFRSSPCRATSTARTSRAASR